MKNAVVFVSFKDVPEITEDETDSGKPDDFGEPEGTGETDPEITGDTDSGDAGGPASGDEGGAGPEDSGDGISSGPEDKKAGSQEEPEAVQLFPEKFNEDIYYMYETAKMSVRNYLRYQSRGLLDFETKILKPQSFKAVPGCDWCLEIDKSEDYYSPRYKWNDNEGVYEEINAEGYDNRYFDAGGNPVREGTADAEGKVAKESIDRVYREQKFLRKVIECVDPGDDGFDGDNDGIVDSLVIITDAEVLSEWGALCWAHMGSVHSFTDDIIAKYYCDYTQRPLCKSLQNRSGRFLGNKEVIPYNILPKKSITEQKADEYNPALCGTHKEEAETSEESGQEPGPLEETGDAAEEHTLYNVGLLCHEALHTTGLCDYYSYEDNEYKSVGEFDIMGNICPLPQNMLAYMRCKSGWLGYNDFEYINDDGVYTVYPQIAFQDSGDGEKRAASLEGNKKKKAAAKIILSDYDETGEYFMIEARAGSKATSEIPFDGGLAGTAANSDGLIIYRVNERASYMQPSVSKPGEYEPSRTENGNMYGPDEVYVFRAGNGNNLRVTDKEGKPTLGNESLALLGVKSTAEQEKKERYVYLAYPSSYCYNMANFGNDNRTMASELECSETGASETMIYYSEFASKGKEKCERNSGIVLSDITVNPDGSVTFRAKLPEKEETPVRIRDAYIDHSHPAGQRLAWKSGAKSGNAYVMVIRSTDRLKDLATRQEDLGLKPEDFRNGTFMNYKVLHTQKVPLAEKYAKLPDFDDEVLIFIMLDSKGSSVIRYVGCIENPDLTFRQYLAKVFDPFYLTLGAIGFIVIALICAALIFNRKSKRTMVSLTEKDGEKEDDAGEAGGK